MEIGNVFKRRKLSSEVKNYLPYLYTEGELAEYEAYIKKSFGDYDYVFHEIISSDIHLDIIVVPPENNYPFIKLVTMGAGAYRMNVPTELQKYSLEYAEYVIYLPGDWNIGSSDERDYWPIRALKNIARLPVSLDTWLGYGHTIQANEDESPYADNTEFSSIMLAGALSLNDEGMNLHLSSGKKINFYQLIPIYAEELRTKEKIGADDLLDLLAAEEGFPILDVKRKNVAS